MKTDIVLKSLTMTLMSEKSNNNEASEIVDTIYSELQSVAGEETNISR
jgi:hypothetical protein